MPLRLLDPLSVPDRSRTHCHDGGKRLALKPSAGRSIADSCWLRVRRELRWHPRGGNGQRMQVPHASLTDPIGTVQPAALIKPPSSCCLVDR